MRKVLSCGAATRRDEAPLARFQCAAMVRACREHPSAGARNHLGGRPRAPLPDGGAGRIPAKRFDRRGPLRFTRGSSRNQRVTKLYGETRGRPPCADFTGGRFPFPASGAKASASEKRQQTVNLGNVSPGRDKPIPAALKHGEGGVRRQQARDAQALAVKESSVEDESLSAPTHG